MKAYLEDTDRKEVPRLPVDVAPRYYHRREPQDAEQALTGVRPPGTQGRGKSLPNDRRPKYPGRRQTVRGT